MLKPSDVPDQSDERARAMRAAIEEYVDEYLRAGVYPVYIPTTRDGWHPAVVAQVASAYRDAGWNVTSGDRRYLFVVDRPSSGRALQAARARCSSCARKGKEQVDD